MGIKSTNSFSASDINTWPALLTIAQTAEILSLSPWTLRQWDKNGKLTPIRLGTRRDRRYKKEDIIKIASKGL
jgi:predicted site-specific integrase-resolvase